MSEPHLADEPTIVAISSTPSNLEDDKKTAMVGTIEATETEKSKAEWAITQSPETDSRSKTSELWRVLWKLARFMGPGAVVSVAYIDPDNYQTALQVYYSKSY
jgi:hypothetical protein